MVGVQAYMISVPGAVSKAVFDMVRDYLRTRQRGDNDKDAETQRVPSRRSINLEEGIRLHRADSSGGSDTPPDSPVNKQERQRPSTENTDTQPNNEITRITNAPRPEILSLHAYLKEKLHDTKLQAAFHSFIRRFPTFSATLGRLPYALLPFAFSQFILVQALDYTGWITLFASWLARVVAFSVPATIFFVTLISVFLCNCSGTNIGATILLVKVLKHPTFVARQGFTSKLNAAGMLALAMGSNIGAVSFVFSASLAGLLWRGILRQKGIHVKGWEFVRWNMLPLVFMMVAGCAIALAVITVAPI